MNKHFTKKAFLFWMPAIFLVIAVSLALTLVYFNSKCHQVEEFSIGNIDNRFKIAPADVRKVANDAADRWNKQTGENLLHYNPNASLKINLIYDQRQADVDKFNTESQGLQKNRQTIESSKEKFDQLLSAYQADLSKYNDEVSYWNSHGGATPAVYGRLEQTRTSLNQRRDQLIAMSKTLNLQSDSYNNNLNDLQNLANSRKNLIITQGLYKSSDDSIDIYTFGNSEELRLVLMHELGHAIGLDHAANQDSIMYYLLGNQDLSNPILTTEDKQMVLSRCKIRNASFYKRIFLLNTNSVN